MEAVLTMVGDYCKAMALPCLIALPVIVVCRWLTYRKTGLFDKKREAFVVLFFLYLTAVLSQTVLPEGWSLLHFTDNPFYWPNSEKTVILLSSPIGWIRWMLTLNNHLEIVRNIGGNILLFIPYGFLFPPAFRQKKRLTVLFGFLLSLTIEISQLFCDRITDINDIILNTFGIIIGYLLYCIISAIMKYKQQTSTKR